MWGEQVGNSKNFHQTANSQMVRNVCWFIRCNRRHCEEIDEKTKSHKIEIINEKLVWKMAVSRKAQRQWKGMPKVMKMTCRTSCNRFFIYFALLQLHSLSAVIISDITHTHTEFPRSVDISSSCFKQNHQFALLLKLHCQWRTSRLSSPSNMRVRMQHKQSESCISHEKSIGVKKIEKARKILRFGLELYPNGSIPNVIGTDWATNWQHKANRVANRNRWK